MRHKQRVKTGVVNIKKRMAVMGKQRENYSQVAVDPMKICKENGGIHVDFFAVVSVTDGQALREARNQLILTWLKKRAT